MSVNATAATGPAGAAETTPPARPWTCPFCPLLCDRFAVAGAGVPGPLALAGSDCPRAAAALARFDGLPPADAGCWVDGQACSLDEALAAAAQRLTAARLPLFGGLGVDVAGARALVRLASLTGAISDTRAGAAQMETLRVQQDRGGYTTTLAEVRERARLIVVFGDAPGDRYPELWNRFGLDDAPGDAGGPARRVVLVGGQPDAALARWTRGQAETVALKGDLLDSASILAALAQGRPVPAATDALRSLAEAMRVSPYTVLLWDAAALPAHGALLVETLQRIVAALNRNTRAGAFALGGGDGASTANQTYTWMTGLPLRSRAGPRGLEHEPVLNDATQLLAQGAVDLLLWVSSFDVDVAPPVTSLTRIVLGPPGMDPGTSPGIFMPVSTPGIGSAGHLFRTDGVVLMPLEPARPDTLPTVADVIRRLGDLVAEATVPTTGGAR